MKAFKKIAAIGAAMMIAVSMMSIGASATPNMTGWKNFGLHYAKGAPSSANLTFQKFTTFNISHIGQMSVDSYISSMSNAHIEIDGFVKDYTIPTSDHWGLAVTYSRYSTGYQNSPRTSYYGNAHVGDDAKVEINLIYSASSNTASAYGKVGAY